jgi:hypothetical protein
MRQVHQLSHIMMKQRTPLEMSVGEPGHDVLPQGRVSPGGVSMNQVLTRFILHQLEGALP